MICVTELRDNFIKNLEQKSMLARLFKKKYVGGKNIRVISDELYACALLNTREAVFYKKYGVPDTFDGRFDLLLVHIFIILHILMDNNEYEIMSQALFDSVFKDMDQTLRELGIGDMGVPKHMKRMMKAFNGRMHSYQWAIDPDSLENQNIDDIKKLSLNSSLKNNLYGSIIDSDSFDDNIVVNMEKFILNNIRDKSVERVSGILNGQMNYIN